MRLPTNPLSRSSSPHILPVCVTICALITRSASFSVAVVFSKLHQLCNENAKLNFLSDLQWVQRGTKIIDIVSEATAKYIAKVCRSFSSLPELLIEEVWCAEGLRKYSHLYKY